MIGEAMTNQKHLIVGNDLECQLAELEMRGIPATIVDGEVRLQTILDNDISQEAWPWDFYIGRSKLQRVILYLLSGWDMWDGDIWRGAVRVGDVKRLVFKGDRLTNSQRASFSRTLMQLEKQGLIVRERVVSDDGYTTHIGLTARGQHQADFECDQYPEKQWRKLLASLGLEYDKYRRSVNKRFKKTKGG